MTNKNEGNQPENKHRSSGSMLKRLVIWFFLFLLIPFWLFGSFWEWWHFKPSQWILGGCRNSKEWFGERL